MPLDSRITLLLALVFFIVCGLVHLRNWCRRFNEFHDIHQEIRRHTARGLTARKYPPFHPEQP